MERESFDVVWAMSEPGSGVAEGCLLRCTDYAHLPEEERHPDSEDHPCAFMPDASTSSSSQATSCIIHHLVLPTQFRQLRPDELASGAVQGFACTAVTFDIPRYLPYLLARFTSGGGSIIRGSVAHIQQVLEGGTKLFASGRSISSSAYISSSHLS